MHDLAMFVVVVGLIFHDEFTDYDDLSFQPTLVNDSFPKTI